MMNLVVDIGNSRVKAAVFEKDTLLYKGVFLGDGEEFVDEVFASHPDIRRCILYSTRGDEARIASALRCRSVELVLFDHDVSVPIGNRYATPHTLGLDRLAAAVGAVKMFPGRDIFIVDLGSAITEDVVSAAEGYLGGNISPGVAMRLKALSAFTGKLPLIDAAECDRYCRCGVPATTKDAMVAGVVEGIYMEIRGLMEIYGAEYPGLVTIFTGGDAPLFEKRFKNTIFANYDLVLTGLNTILDYNADTENSL